MATDKFDLQLDTEQDNVVYENSLILPILLTILKPRLLGFVNTGEVAYSDTGYSDTV